MTTWALKYIKKPPLGWEIEVLTPLLWRGRFTSTDGITWWSPVLERNLGEHHSNPGEDKMLERLRALARNHHLARMETVVQEARTLVESWSTGSAVPDLFSLRNAIAELDGRRAAPRSTDPLYVGDGHPDVRRARYERTEEIEEP